jgi:hypothetical protein
MFAGKTATSSAVSPHAAARRIAATGMSNPKPPSISQMPADHDAREMKRNPRPAWREKERRVEQVNRPGDEEKSGDTCPYNRSSHAELYAFFRAGEPSTENLTFEIDLTPRHLF